MPASFWMSRRARRLGVGGRQSDDVVRGLTEVGGFTAVGDDTRLGFEKMRWSVGHEVAMPNDALSVTFRIASSAPESRFENSPSSAPRAGNQCRSGWTMA